MITVFDDVNEVPIKAFLERNGFMSCPLKLTIHLSGRNENGQFPEPGADPGVIPEVLIEFPFELRQLRAKSAIPGRPTSLEWRPTSPESNQETK